MAGGSISSAPGREAQPLGRLHHFLLDGRGLLEHHASARIPEPVATHEPDDRAAALGAEPEQVDLDVEVFEVREVAAQRLRRALARDLPEVAQYDLDATAADVLGHRDVGPARPRASRPLVERPAIAQVGTLGRDREVEGVSDVDADLVPRRCRADDLGAATDRSRLVGGGARNGGPRARRPTAAPPVLRSKASVIFVTR